ncbi:hypothetical protein OC195_14780 [Priestia flexa]|nr:hypothetical protein OC195_14780 [Priestia flexa]
MFYQLKLPGLYTPNQLIIHRASTEIPNLTEKEQFQHIWSMRREKGVNVELGSLSPHLIIHLESNKVLFVNGRDPNYECSGSLEKNG